MTNDSQTRDTLIAILLRLTLGVIFLWHGIEKVRSGDLGANWATAVWEKPAKAPEGAVKNLEASLTNRIAQLEKRIPELEKEVSELSDKVKKAKEDEKDKTQKELDDKQKQLEERRKEKATLEQGKTAVVQTFTHHYTAVNLQMPELTQLYVVQLLVAWGEVIGGVALLLGLLTRVAAFGMMLIQLGAIYSLTAARGFSIGTIADGGGPEYNVALVVMCLALVLEGGGALAVDHVLNRGRRTQHAVASPAPGMRT